MAINDLSHDEMYKLVDALASLDTWQPEATPAAPVSKPCSECGMYDGVHDLHCKNADDDAEWRDTPPAAPAEDMANPDEDLEQYERDKAEVQA